MRTDSAIIHRVNSKGARETDAKERAIKLREKNRTKPAEMYRRVYRVTFEMNPVERYISSNQIKLQIDIYKAATRRANKNTDTVL